VLLRVSRLVEEVPEIVELDLNPIIAMPAPRGVTLSTRECESRGQPEPPLRFPVLSARRAPANDRPARSIWDAGAGQTTVQVCG
jgi:hypothetical protein